MRIKEYFTLQNIALFIVLLFHVSGAIGILFTDHKQWFISNTPLNLLLSAALLFITQKQKNSAFFLLILVCGVTGFLAEVIGTSTGLLFGNYKYGNVLGFKVKDVPLLIGVNWFVAVYCVGIISSQMQAWSNKKLIEMDATISNKTKTLSFIFDGAILATFFDFIMEPVAVKLGFWQWLGDGSIPFYNYVCWFVISALLLLVFRLLSFNKHNPLAVHLFIIQLLFFLLLRLFL